MSSIRVLVVFLSGAGTLVQPAVTRTETPPFPEILRRAHAYVTLYEDHQLSTVIARERYHQRWLDAGATVRGERTILSDYLLLQLPDEDWLAVRDVYEIDGVAVADRAARLKALFAGPREQLLERVMTMTSENARLNLGDTYFRTVNLPTFALRLLRPASRKRVTYESAGEELVEGSTTSVVAFRETKGPTFSATPDGKDIPASGRFWVEPATGVVRRSEMILGGTRRLPARATITVTYRPDPALGFHVPVEMRERYDVPRHKEADVVIASATYADFRRFDWRSFTPPR